MESMNYVKNSGSFFFFLGSIPSLVGTRFIINLIAVFFRRYALARQVGMIAYSPNNYEFMMMAFQKLVLETFTDLCLITFLQLIYFYNPSNILQKLWAKQGVYDMEIGTTLFYSGFGEFFCHFCAFITCLIFVIFTLYGGLMIIIDHRYMKLPDQNMRKKYKVLMDGTRQGGLSPKLQNISYMLRRYVVVAIIIFLQNYASIQIILLLVISLLNQCYLAQVKPFEDKRQNKIDIFNEVILSASYIIVLIYGHKYP